MFSIKRYQPLAQYADIGARWALWSTSSQPTDPWSNVPADPMNEVTFVSRLGAVTRVRAEKRIADGEPLLIYSGEVEEKQVDPVTGKPLRCDIRLNAKNGTKLVSGEMKRPEHSEGRDPRNESLREDARNKAIARGLPFYFTCNMADIVLYEVATKPDEADREIGEFHLAKIKNSREVQANIALIEAEWINFLDELERRLETVATTRPSVTTRDVIIVRDAIQTIADEAIDRVMRHVLEDEALADEIRDEALNQFGLSVALDSEQLAETRHELQQILRLGAFVVAQKLLLYRVLAEVGPKRGTSFSLDNVPSVGGSSDPLFIQAVVNRAAAHAMERSKDYETAFLLKPLDEVIFTQPNTPEEALECRVGDVWQGLFDALAEVAWTAISRNLVGFLYEALVDPEFQHDLGQYYTPEDIVDLLVTFAIRESTDVAIDPACGGGSFLRSTYHRKRDLGATHEQALAEIWGCEITAFAAELSTVTLATADPHEPAAYPQILLRDFFTLVPGMNTELQLPDRAESLKIPDEYDAIIGNPPYISYRRQTNQSNVATALGRMAGSLDLPQFSGKSDEYVWFMAYGTKFLRVGGRFCFVVSAAILFSDYGIPLIRFLGRQYRIRAVVDSAVERWFPEADTNTVLVFLEREDNAALRENNEIRFLRFRRPLARLLPVPDDPDRREALEELMDEILSAPRGDFDPRFMVNVEKQGKHGGLTFLDSGVPDEEDESEESN